MDLTTLPQPAAQVLLQDAAGRDLATARRMALLQILLHERYLTREQLITRVEGQFGLACFGASAWQDVFYRDMRVVKAALKSAGFTLGYSRGAGRNGYYLRGQGAISAELAEVIRQSAAEVDPAQLAIFRRLTPAARARLGSSVTDAARNAVAYRLRQQHPDLSPREASFYALQGRLP